MSDENKLTEEIIGAAMEVHSFLGPGLLESAYEKCLEFEIARRGFKTVSQLALPIQYKEIKIDGGYRIDLLTEDKVIVEIKAVSSIQPVHKAQLLSYLKMSIIRVGLLLNFNVERLKQGITRIVNS